MEPNKKFAGLCEVMMEFSPPNGPEWALAGSHSHSRPPLRIKGWVWSLFLHVAVLLPLVLLTHKPTFTPPSPTVSIQAKLLPLPQPAPEPTVSTESPTIAVPEPADPVPETTVPPTPATLSEAHVKAIVNEEPVTPATVVKPKPAEEPAAVQAEDPAAVKEDRRANNPSGQKSLKNLEQYFSQQRQQQQAREAEQAAQAFRQKKLSPDLVDTRKGQLQEEDRPGPRPTKVNCDSSVNKTLAILSTIAGGTLKCSDRNTQYEQYIDQRKKVAGQD